MCPPADPAFAAQRSSSSSMATGKFKALQRWLVLVACLRLLSVGIGLLNPDKFKTTVVDLTPEYVNPLFGRLFAAWTTVTCVLCLVCAYDPTNKGSYVATLASFIVALAFFLSETFLFHTISIKCATSPFIVASISTVWMLIGFNYYTRDAKPEGIEKKVT